MCFKGHDIEILAFSRKILTFHEKGRPCTAQFNSDWLHSFFANMLLSLYQSSGKDHRKGAFLNIFTLLNECVITGVRLNYTEPYLGVSKALGCFKV